MALLEVKDLKVKCLLHHYLIQPNYLAKNDLIKSI